MEYQMDRMLEDQDNYQNHLLSLTEKEYKQIFEGKKVNVKDEADEIKGEPILCDGDDCDKMYLKNGACTEIICEAIPF